MGKDTARRARLAAQASRNAAEAALRQRSGTALSSWGVITDAELDLLLEFIGQARRAPSGISLTSDGRWRISLRQPQAAAAAMTLLADSGRLVTLDWQFEMESP
jgi:hypothetical protein